MRKKSQENRMKVVLIIDCSETKQRVSDVPHGILLSITALVVTMNHPIYIRHN